MAIASAIAKALFQFFTSEKTPNSSFYVTAGTIIASITSVLTASSNPWLMGIGGILAAVYTIANNYAEARKTQAAADAFNSTLHASIRMGPPSLPITELTPEAAAAVASAVVDTVKEHAAREAK